MTLIWDYDTKNLNKTEQGRILILERMINYGPGKEKIKLADVKKYWKKLDIFPPQQRLFEYLIWGKISSSPKNKSLYWQK